MTKLVGGGAVKMALTLLQNLKQSTATGSTSMKNGYMYADRWLHHTDGNWYWFDKDGYMSNSGWKKINSNGTISMQTVPCRLAG